MKMSLSLSGLLLTALLLLSSCQSCVDHSGVDSGTSQSDAGTLAPGSVLALQELPLERLCEVFNSAFYRYTFFVSFGLSAAMGSDPNEIVAECGGHIEERSYDLLRYSPGYLKADCRDDLPNMFSDVVRRLQVSVQAGRVRYQPRAAMECLRSGRELIDEAGGMTSLYRDNADAGSADGAMPESCDTWLQGLVPAGEACEEHWDCANGSHCKRSLDSCAGTCTAIVALGAPCATFDQCAENGHCEGDICVAAEEETPLVVVGAGLPCEDTDSQEVECDQGLYCNGDGVCQVLPGDGLACAGGKCAAGLTCGPDGAGGSICGAPRVAGEVCTGYSSSCARCYTCVSDNDSDDSPSHCRTYRRRGESCGEYISACLIGDTCINSSCRAAAARGQECWLNPEGETLQGSCFAVGDFCQVSQGSDHGTCVKRALEAEPCVAQARTTSQRGSCTATSLFCARAAADASTGTCALRPKMEQPCGDRHDLSEDCLSGECVTQTDGSGLCQTPPPPQPNDPCDYDDDCPTAHYCDTSSDTCLAAPGLGGLCASTGYECAEGYCEYGGAATDYEYTCVPFLPPGSACDHSGDDACEPTSYCRQQADDSYLCVEGANVGGTCEDGDDCLPGLACASGVCVEEICQRDSCGGCSDKASLTTLLFFGMTLSGGAWRRRCRTTGVSDWGFRAARFSSRACQPGFTVPSSKRMSPNVR